LNQKEKWFWCNKEEWKAYMEKMKKAKKVKQKKIKRK
jgi:hypothetical protein